MKRSLLAVFLGVAPFVSLARDAVAQTGLTIYMDGRVLVRRVMPVRLAAGTSVQQLGLGPIDPGSIFALDSGITITGLRYDPAIGQVNALRRSVGRELSFATRGANGAREVVTATVLGVDPERYRLADGRVTFERPGSPLFPAELVPAEASLSLGVSTDKARPSFGLGYFTSGASWYATYAVLLGARTARIAGHAVISAGTLATDSAEVQLLAGNVGRAGPARRPMAEMAGKVAAAPMAMDVAAQQSIGDVHLYSLSGRYSFEPGIETSAALFEPANAAFERTYTVQGELPYYGGLGQTGGDEQTIPVQVNYVIKRAARTPFGDTPLPGGVARLYERDQAGRPQLVGESTLEHTAAGQNLRLDAGAAFDLTARRVQTDYQTQREGQRTVATASYSVKVANAKDSTATVDVLETRAGEWSVVSSSLPAEKVSSTVTRFRVRVAPKGETVLTYRVRVVW